MFGAICFLFLVFGCGLWVGASGFRRASARIAARIVGSVFLLAFLAAMMLIAPYLWAVHLEAKWRPRNPSTKAQMEACLSLYTAHNIQPSESLWGHDYQLGPGERMTQYRLLYAAPLDVVYTSNDTVVRIYTSYE
jgi:hypothetical protein